MPEDKIRIGITIGDINGIAPEVILKSVVAPAISEEVTIIIYAQYHFLEEYRLHLKMEKLPLKNIDSAKEAVANRINIINQGNEPWMMNIGKATKVAGGYALQALKQAAEDLNNGIVDAVVTGPVNKQTIQLHQPAFRGQTEFFTATSQASDSLMLLASDQLKVALATNHVPVSAIAPLITKKLIEGKLATLSLALQQDFAISHPRIAVLGLNPHAGDSGLLGNEEKDIIAPAIQDFNKSGGGHSTGPFPADGFFGSKKYNEVDAILAMYHDQGLAPFKALTFGGGVNITCGLPVVRTSPDHGTAYDLAGKNRASPHSMIKSILQAVSISKNRRRIGIEG